MYRVNIVLVMEYNYKVLTMVKDEVDIVKQWIEHHGKIFGFKNLFVIDNYSTDGTFEVIKEYEGKINIYRMPDYSKKGEYMSKLINSLQSMGTVFFPIDIDEFIVFRNPVNNTIFYNKEAIHHYLQWIIKDRDTHVYKMNYITSGFNDLTDNKIIGNNPMGKFEDYGNAAKTFFTHINNPMVLDHGNHYITNKYKLSKLCLVHFHCRNMEQMKKKIYNNVRGLNYPVTDLQKLKEMIENTPTCIGNHHVKNQIRVLENTFTLPLISLDENDVDYVNLDNFVKYLEELKMKQRLRVKFNV